MQVVRPQSATGRLRVVIYGESFVRALVCVVWRQLLVLEGPLCLRVLSFCDAEMLSGLSVQNTPVR